MLRIFLLVSVTVVTSVAAPVLPSPEDIAAKNPITAVDSDCATRSLYTIIWGCLVTLFACGWSVYHPNVPTSKAREERTLLGIVVPYSASPSWWRRPIWLCIAIVVPEFVLIIALGEGVTADALTIQDFIRFAAVEMDDIMDKSKSDAVKETIVYGQILWFIIQFAARSHRATNGTTHLEVLTVAIAALSCMTLEWWNGKPQDVQRPIILPPAGPESRLETTVDSADTVHLDRPNCPICHQEKGAQKE
ncbi:hypothetical protein BDZ89DRAFT_1145806 [Hymenopellis radicata]|nr:hypothetical protein BDZ89DRAFT_1145806 [Hymenopellis radicata]